MSDNSKGMALAYQGVSKDRRRVCAPGHLGVCRSSLGHGLYRAVRRVRGYDSMWEQARVSL